MPAVMAGLLFWDVDTQYDFMFSDGKLYVPDAENTLPALARLTRFARARGVRIVASVDHHSLGDPELAASPDYRTTYPPHCLAGSPGAAKVDATRAIDPLWIDAAPVDATAVARHRGEIVFRKQRFDVFTNPNVSIYGTALSGLGTVKVTIARSSLVNNGYGPTVDAGTGAAIMTVSESIVTGNNVGYYNNGATLESLGNNTFRSNISNTGAMVLVGLQ